MITFHIIIQPQKLLPVAVKEELPEMWKRCGHGAIIVSNKHDTAMTKIFEAVDRK